MIGRRKDFEHQEEFFKPLVLDGRAAYIDLLIAAYSVHLSADASAHANRATYIRGH